MKGINIKPLLRRQIIALVAENIEQQRINSIIQMYQHHTAHNISTQICSLKLKFVTHLLNKIIRKDKNHESNWEKKSNKHA